MFRHWLVRYGTKVTDPLVYITTSDEDSDSQLDQVLLGVRKKGWDFNNVFVVEKATSSSHKSLIQLIREKMK